MGRHAIRHHFTRSPLSPQRDTAPASGCRLVAAARLCKGCREPERAHRPPDHAAKQPPPGGAPMPMTRRTVLTSAAAVGFAVTRRARAADTLKIGVVSPLTGPAAQS